MTDETEDKVVIKPDLEKYDSVTSASGKKSHIRSGDPVSLALVGFSLDQVYAVAYDLGVELKDYSNLNDGMQRMCIGNKIRGWINRQTRANDAAIAKNEKPGLDPLTALNKVCSPIRKDNEKAAKEATAKAKKEAKAA